MISKDDVIILNNLTLSENELATCKYIAQKTFNTWQSGRTFDQKLNDTIVGNIAEKAIKEYFYQQCKDNFNPYIAFYDDFREDNFNHHNEIDFIFSKSIDQLLNAQAYIQKHLTNSKLKSHKSKFINNDVFICEIKSTRIPAKSDRLKTNGAIDIDKILDDDFLSYPFFKRTSSTINNKDDYIREISGELKLSEQEILKEKTKGNLVKEEEDFMTNVTRDLKLKYVEMSKK
jgi:hypothetical protein